MALRLQTPRRPMRRPTPYATNAFPASAFAPRAVPVHGYPSNPYSAAAYPAAGYPAPAYAPQAAPVYPTNAYPAPMYQANPYAQQAPPVNQFSANAFSTASISSGFGTHGVVGGRNIVAKRYGASSSQSAAIPMMVWVILGMVGVAIIMLIVAINHNKAQEVANMERLERGLERQAAAKAHNERIWQKMEEEERMEAARRDVRREALRSMQR